MKDKKIIILIVLGIAAVVSLLYGVTSHPKIRSVPVSAPDIGQGAQATSLGAGVVKRRVVRTKFKSWKRSPFVAKSQATPTNLVLNGIIGGKVPKAMIGDALVGVGDKIGNNTVVAIKSDKVLLNDGTKDFELVMKQ